MIPRISPKKRAVAVVVAASAVMLNVALLAPAAHADDANTLTVVGTSDVFDSHLVQAVLKPGFEKLYPDVNLKYVSLGTGAAIAYAEQGTASALLVHAASLENQFVGNGYSAEQYGRAIFWGDYVLLGPASDPAGVMNGDSHNIVGAFEKIAAAGAKGKADFVSRGGTPGTTVQEHKIWNLTTGVPTCQVSTTLGGGAVPSTDTGDCPTTIDYPSWYHTTGLTQGPNIINADTCNYGHGTDCYAITDRGTFQYLEAHNELANLQILTRNNNPKATGGQTLLVNSFHAYAVNPQKFAGDPNVQINETAALNFLNYVTSPSGQKAVGNYLGGKGDPPFIPDAAPAITSTISNSTVTLGDKTSVYGAVKNVVPGTPALAGETVTLTGVPGNPNGTTTTRTATTDSKGKYTFKFAPKAGATYTVSTSQITQTEDGTLSPPFSDILEPASTVAGTVHVTQS